MFLWYLSFPMKISVDSLMSMHIPFFSLIYTRVFFFLFKDTIFYLMMMMKMMNSMVQIRSMKMIFLWLMNIIYQTMMMILHRLDGNEISHGKNKESWQKDTHIYSLICMQSSLENPLYSSYIPYSTQEHDLNQLYLYIYIYTHIYSRFVRVCACSLDLNNGIKQEIFFFSFLPFLCILNKNLSMFETNRFCFSSYIEK